MIVFAEGTYGIFHIVEYSKLLAKAQRYAAEDRHAASSPWIVQDYNLWLNLIPDSQDSSYPHGAWVGWLKAALSPTPMYSARDDADSAFVPVYTIVHTYVNKNVRL